MAVASQEKKGKFLPIDMFQFISSGFAPSRNFSLISNL